MSAMILMSCAKSDNPFFTAYENEYGAPPFEKIKTEHYLPAFKEGIKQHQAEIDAVADSKDAPTFTNTIEHWIIAVSCCPRSRRYFSTFILPKLTTKWRK